MNLLIKGLKYDKKVTESLLGVKDLGQFPIQSAQILTASG